MEWFVGDVEAAIISAKAKQTIFCVCITGSLSRETSAVLSSSSNKLFYLSMQQVCISNIKSVNFKN